MKILKRGLILSCLFFLFMPSASLGETKKIRVVYTDWFPYTYQENAEPSGFEIEIFKAVMKNMNIETEFVNYPWKRCLSNLQNGTADALVSVLKTPEREKYAYFPKMHISISKTVFFTKNDKGIKFKGSYEDLRDYTIGVITGFSYGDAFDKADYLKKDSAVDAHMLITKLLNGRHDLAAENKVVITAYAIKMGVRDKIRFLEPPIHTQRLYVGFSKAKKLQKLCNDFSRFLTEFKTTEAYKAILEKYGVDD